MRGYLDKAGEFLAAAGDELAAERFIAATSLAIHAAINAADAVTGSRTGCRAAGQDHEEVRSLLWDSGKDGAELDKDLGRLLPLKTKAEYEPDDLAASACPGRTDARHCAAAAQQNDPSGETTAWR
ncbi:MAG: DNA-binding protein [Actinobacteria bacterium]|nr:DNA-binding protein [Actinomycetota bacterium]